MEGSTYKHRYFYFYLVDKDLQHCLISNSKTTHAIHDEFHEPHYQRHVSPWSKTSDPRANLWNQETTTPPSHLLSHLKVLDVSPTQSIILFSGHPPQNRNVLKRQAPPSGNKHHPCNIWHSIRFTARRLTTDPHSRTQPLARVLTMFWGMWLVLMLWDRVRKCGGVPAKAEVSVKDADVPCTSSLPFRCNCSFLGIWSQD